VDPVQQSKKLPLIVLSEALFFDLVENVTVLRKGVEERW